MLKKSITFEDLDGNTRTEVFNFHLTKAEIAEMELGAKGGSMSKLLTEIIAQNDASLIIDTFKMIIEKAYGERGEDGIRFIKSPELSAKFLQTDAYSELFMELVTDALKAAEFIEGVVPQAMKDHLQKTDNSARAVESLDLPSESDIQTIVPEQKHLSLPDAGTGPVNAGGPFEGLTETQVNSMSKEDLRMWLTNPEAFTAH